MTKLEILQNVVNIHNCLVGIMVSGDNAIMMGESLKGLRALAREIQKDVEQEDGAESEAQAESET